MLGTGICGEMFGLCNALHLLAGCRQILKRQTTVQKIQTTVLTVASKNDWILPASLQDSFANLQDSLEFVVELYLVGDHFLKIHYRQNDDTKDKAVPKETAANLRSVAGRDLH